MIDSAKPARFKLLLVTSAGHTKFVRLVLLLDTVHYKSNTVRGQLGPMMHDDKS